MEWLERMDMALDYIEGNLENAFDIESIAKAAYSSPFHFQRMFHILTGITVGEYVRRRKLTLAAQELAVSSTKVLDVALKYGYSSAESFSKMFRKIHGISPSEARKSGVPLKAYPRLSFKLTIQGESEVDYHIVEKEAFKVVGKSAEISCGNEGQNRQWFWRKCNHDGTLSKLTSNDSSPTLLGIALNFEENFTYMIASLEENAKIQDLPSRIIPPSTWAIFPCVGPIPEAIQNRCRQIYLEWFPATGYEHAGFAEIEVYPPGNTLAKDYKSEVWVPIIKK